MIVIIMVIVYLIISGTSKVNSMVTYNPTTATSVRELYLAMAINSGLRFQVPINTILAIICVESGGNANAVGSAGERGLMQLKEDAMNDSNSYAGSSIQFDEMFLPINNIFIGAGYLAWLMYDQGLDHDSAIRSYNIGVGNFRAGKNLDTAQIYFDKVQAYRTFYGEITT